MEDTEEIKALFDKRESIPLTSENATFARSEGGLISLTIHYPDKEDEFFERVVPLRACPITDPDDYISIREPDTVDKGHGDEIGLIDHMSLFNEETQALLRSELDRHYFTPELTKISKVTEKFGYLYFECTTSAGPVSFVMSNPYSNFRSFEDGRVFLYDIDGNCFQITDPNKMDKASLRKIEIYL